MEIIDVEFDPINKKVEFYPINPSINSIVVPNKKCKQENKAEENFTKLMKNIVVNKVKNIEYTNIEEYKKSIDQNITQLGKLDQGRIEILKTLETAVEKEFYYNGKKKIIYSEMIPTKEYMLELK